MRKIHLVQIVKRSLEIEDMLEETIPFSSKKKAIAEVARQREIIRNGGEESFFKNKRFILDDENALDSEIEHFWTEGLEDVNEYMYVLIETKEIL